MAGIFISYRREDAAGWAGRLADDLRRAFPAHEVFFDIASIDIGEDFVEALQRSLAACSVVLVLIGPRWLSASGAAGGRRLDDPHDWVQLEVAESLKRSGLRVIPVLLGGARVPEATDLPKALRPLSRRNAHEISDKRWDYDVTQLVAALGRNLSPTISKAPAIESESKSEVAASGRPESVPGTVFQDGNDFPEMIVIPAGEFSMGSPETYELANRDELPQHNVRIARAFALARYEQTVAQFARFVAETGYRTEAERNPKEGIRQPGGIISNRSWRDPDFEQGGDHPVVAVSWNDAIAYTTWLSKRTGNTYRLPSESEWEYAARAGTTTIYPWGDAPDANHAKLAGFKYQWFKTAPVGSFDPNQFGLYDMIGNVWEWVQDCWNEDYSGGPADGRAWESGDCDLRIARGGSYATDPKVARVAFRYRYGASLPASHIGFRVARTI